MNDRNEENPLTVARYGLLQGLQGVHQQVPRPVLLSELLRFVHNSAGVDPLRVQQAINDDPGIARQYAMLLSRERLMFSPRQAAAASQSHSGQRRGEGFVLKIVESRAQNHQVYVILEVDELLELPADRDLVLHIVSPHGSGILSLPPVHDGKSQCILSQDDPYVRLLRDQDTEISIL